VLGCLVDISGDAEKFLREAQDLVEEIRTERPGQLLEALDKISRDA